MKVRLEDKEGLYGEEYHRKNNWLLDTEDPQKSKKTERLDKEIGDLRNKFKRSQTALNKLEVDRQRGCKVEGT